MFDIDEPISLFCVDDEDDYIFNRQLTPQQNLLAAITHRALRDAQGYRLGSDTDSGNNHIQRGARKWFRKRDMTDGWGWIVEALGIPPWMERRIFQEAFTDKAFKIRSKR